MTSATARSAMPGQRCTTCLRAASEHARIARSPSQCFAESDICTVHLKSKAAPLPEWAAASQTRHQGLMTEQIS